MKITKIAFNDNGIISSKNFDVHGVMCFINESRINLEIDGANPEDIRIAVPYYFRVIIFQGLTNSSEKVPPEVLVNLMGCKVVEAYENEIAVFDTFAVGVKENSTYKLKL
jgi:hypothetical protein